MAGMGQVWRTCRLPDLFARTEALIGEIVIQQTGQCVVIERSSFRLTNNRLIPIQPDGQQIISLALIVLIPDRGSIQILISQQEPTVLASDRKPRDQRGPQIADV